MSKTPAITGQSKPASVPQQGLNPLPDPPTPPAKPISAPAPIAPGVTAKDATDALKGISVENNLPADTPGRAMILPARYTYGVYIKAANTEDIFTVSLTENNPALIAQRVRDLLKTMFSAPQIYSFRIRSIEIL